MATKLGGGGGAKGLSGRTTKKKNFLRLPLLGPRSAVGVRSLVKHRGISEKNTYHI